jgi:hypothetical protein
LNRTEATQQGFIGSGTICSESAVAWSFAVAFQRKKSGPVGVKTPLPGFVEPGCADDEAAIQFAKLLVNGHDKELCPLDRRIAKFERKATKSAASDQEASSCTTGRQLMLAPE